MVPDSHISPYIHIIIYIHTYTYILINSACNPKFQPSMSKFKRIKEESDGTHMEGPRIFGSLCSTSRSRLGLKLPSKVCDRSQPRRTISTTTHLNCSGITWYLVVSGHVPNRMLLWIDLTDMGIHVCTQLCTIYTKECWDYTSVACNTTSLWRCRPKPTHVPGPSK